MKENAHALAFLQLAIVVGGAVVPITAFLLLNHWMVVVKDNLAWEEGGGWLVGLGALAIIALCQVIGLVLAGATWTSLIGKASAVLAVMILVGGCGVLVLWLR